jgi:hypothetical protein
MPLNSWLKPSWNLIIKQLFSTKRKGATQANFYTNTKFGSAVEDVEDSKSGETPKKE